MFTSRRFCALDFHKSFDQLKLCEICSRHRFERQHKKTSSAQQCMSVTSVALSNWVPQSCRNHLPAELVRPRKGVPSQESLNSSLPLPQYTRGEAEHNEAVLMLCAQGHVSILQLRAYAASQGRSRLALHHRIKIQCKHTSYTLYV